MTRINTKIKKGVYESKKARDLLDEEFTEFSPTKRSVSEFFDIYSSKFYNIKHDTHDTFIKKSLEYIIEYINPKQITLEQFADELINTQEDIDSIELFHPTYPNGTVLKMKGSSAKWLIQSGKKRRIDNNTLFKEIKLKQKLSKISDGEFWIEVDGGTSGIPSSKPINITEDLLDSTSVINTYTGPY